ncbi:hypothetical protein [Aquimarina sp. 433]
MKQKKSIDTLLEELRDQKGAVMTGNHGKSIQYWCGLSVVGGDELQSSPPNGPSTGSQMTDTPDLKDKSDCQDPDH